MDLLLAIDDCRLIVVLSYLSFEYCNLGFIWNLVLEICDLRRTPFQQRRFIRVKFSYAHDALIP